MWIITNFGFFSVVQKNGDDDLTIRSRIKDDLLQLRDRYLPSLSSIIEGGGTDYPFRAKASYVAVSEAISKAIKDIDYPNFKNSVATEQGTARAHLYSDVWTTLSNLKDELPTPHLKPQAKQIAAPGKAPAYGGVVVDKQGRFLLRKPSGEYDGYVWTFAKGRAKPGQTPQQAALCEVQEETGWVCEIISKLPGSFAGGTSSTEYFLMMPIKNLGAFDFETQEIVWVDPAEAKQRIAQTRNVIGRKRDHAVLEAALEVLKGKA